MATATARPPVTTAVSGGGDDGNEVCAGCGAHAPGEPYVAAGRLIPAGKQPWVGIGHPEPAKGTTAEGTDGLDPADMVSHPVCNACHQDPAHRTLSPLKVHFFAREDRKLAVAAARAQIMRADD